MPRLIRLHYWGGEAIEHDVLIIAEFLETIERGSICLRRAHLPVLLQLDDDTLHKVEQRVFVRIAVKLVDDIIGGVSQAVSL